MRVLVVGLLLVAALSAQERPVAEWLKLVDQAESEAKAKNYLAAGQTMTQLFDAMMRSQSGSGGSGPVDMDKLPKQAELPSWFQRLRGQVAESDRKALLHTVFVVSSALDKLYSELDAKERFRQLGSQAGPMGAGHHPFVRSQLMWAAMEAESWADAAVLARDVLEAKEGNWYAYRAHTVLGLEALSRKDLEGAKAQLELSRLAIQLDQNFRNTIQPDLQLANGVLEAGERALIVKYLDTCIQFEPWQILVDVVQRYRDEVASGRRNDLKPLDLKRN